MVKVVHSLALLTAMATLAVAVPTDYRSPSTICASADGQFLYGGQKTAGKVVRVLPASGKVDQSYSLPAEPNGLAISNDGKTLFVTVEEPDGRVYMIQTESGKMIREIKAGHTPMSPTLSSDEKTLYVCNRFNNNVAVIRVESGKTLKTIPVVREPVAMVLTPDGRFLYVANHLPTGAANVDFMASVISVIDTRKQAVVKEIQLPNGAIDLRGITVSPDGKIIYVPSIFARFLVPTTQLERGWMNTHALNIIDAERQQLMHTVLLDDVDLGAANPWGVACSPDNRYIVVAHSGTHELSIIDRAALFAKLAAVPENDGTQDFEELADNPMNDLSFLYGMRRRIHLDGIGPRNLAILNGRAYVTEYFSDSLGVVALDPEVVDNVRSVPLGPEIPADAVRLGEMYFNDASLCYQQWQSCSTCHPDVRTDAVNWDLLNDGIGNPKSTKSLLFAHYTPPAMVSGIRADAETAVRAGFRHIQFSMPDEDKALAIDAFLKSLTSIPSPHMVDGKLSEAARRGKVLFDGIAECSDCHSGPYYTNLHTYDVGTGADNEDGTKFDVPMLREIWRTAPYLYDGRAATLKDAFRLFNPKDRHGTTSELSDEELDDLIEYVLSL